MKARTGFAKGLAITSLALAASGCVAAPPQGDGFAPPLPAIPYPAGQPVSPYVFNSVACMRDWARPECQPGGIASTTTPGGEPVPALPGPRNAPHAAFGAAVLAVGAIVLGIGISRVLSFRLPPMSQWPQR